MPRKSTGYKTKVALADALLNILSEGTPLAKIPIRDITSACGLDRQTFYYHFDNIYELAQFSYEQEIKRIFETDDVESVYEIDWLTRARAVLHGVEDNPVLRDTIVPSLGEAPIHAAILEVVANIMKRDFVPHMIEAGLEEEFAHRRARLATHALTGTLEAWIRHELEGDIDELLDGMKETVDDYLAGIKARRK